MGAAGASSVSPILEFVFFNALSGDVTAVSLGALKLCVILSTFPTDSLPSDVDKIKQFFAISKSDMVILDTPILS